MSTVLSGSSGWTVLVSCSENGSAKSPDIQAFLCQTIRCPQMLKNTVINKKSEDFFCCNLKKQLPKESDRPDRL